jgi:hypothetical protein
MSVESRERFAGLVTNAAGPVAPNGALDEAENVVVRKPGAIEPRDGLRPADGMDGSEIWGLVHQKRDLVMRYNGIEVRYFDLLGTEITYKGGLPPMPMRRDILTYAQARGNLYLPTERGVVRLVEGSGEWQDAGLVNVNVAGAFALTDGPPAPHFLTGTTMFSGTTFMDLPAGQGSVPAATFWVAAHVYLRSIPPALESNVVFARGRGAGVAVTSCKSSATAGTLFGGWVAPPSRSRAQSYRATQGARSSSSAATPVAPARSGSTACRARCSPAQRRPRTPPTS